VSSGSKVPVRFPHRFASHLRDRADLRPGQRVIVATSGGMDSTVLLHLLRFSLSEWGLDLHAAHLDHAARESSRSDAAWVAGLCRAWDVPLIRDVAAIPPRNEDESRKLRYTFLEGARDLLGADWVLTAHHADDQAETVLFRAVRGAGLRGLGGIPPQRDGWLLRPLLPFTRDAIGVYAKQLGLRWRVDPTNTDPRFRRNVLRHSVLPVLERDVAPGAALSLRRIADQARALDGVVSGLAEATLASVTVHSETGRWVLDRKQLVRIPAAARAEVLRAAASRLGGALSRTGTRIAVEVSSPDCHRGGRDLGGGIHLSVQYEDVVMKTNAWAGVSRPLRMSTDGDGAGGLLVGGRGLSAQWSRVTGKGGGELPTGHAMFALDELNFPVVMREWRPGDRIRFAYGSKKLKELFQEARLPRWRRERQPLLVDAANRVLWAPELARSATAMPLPGQPSLRVAVKDVALSPATG
jgi:tRNA(Ile)-lysidine synthase